MAPAPRALAGLLLYAALGSACGDDATPPTVTLRATPCCQITLAGDSVIVEADATDDQGVSRVEFFAKAPGDSVATQFAEDSESPFAVAYPSGGFAEADNGVHALSAEAYDAAGNVGTSSAVIIVVVIDATAPGIALTTTSGSRTTTAGFVRLTAATGEPITRLELYDGAVRIGEVAATGTIPITHTFVVPVTAAENGTHVFTARAADVAGNIGVSAPVSVTVDIRWAWRSDVWGSGSYGAIYGLAADGTNGVYAGGVLVAQPPGTDAVLVKLDAAGNVVWTRVFGDAAGSATGASVARDVTGDVYLGAGSGGDCYIAKYDAAGALIWSRRIDGGAEDDGGFVAVDGLGGVYVGGSTSGSLDGNPNPDGRDAFLIRYDRDGNQVWSRQFGSTGGPYPDGTVSGIAADSSGSAYIVGTTWGSIGGATPTGLHDVFVAKYSGAGDQLWLRLLGTANTDFGGGVTVDPSGSVYVTGGNYGGFGGRPPDGSVDAFVAKFDSAGTPLWARQVGTGDYDAGNAVAADANGVHVVGYTGGQFSGMASTPE
ncbi:MAG: SBBP repeat-containing protein, partial [Gemmatimonadales bacterium]